MGINFSFSTLGTNNVNLFGAKKIEYDEFENHVGLFANLDVNGGRVLKGVFAEASVKGNALNVTYATDWSETASIEGGLRFRLYKNDLMGVDLNFFHNTLMLSPAKFVNFGSNILCNFPEGHLLAVGVSFSSPLFQYISLDGMCKMNLLKSETHGINIDILTNISVNLSGPLAGSPNFVASLLLSYDLLQTFSKTSSFNRLIF